MLTKGVQAKLKRKKVTSRGESKGTKVRGSKGKLDYFITSFKNNRNKFIEGYEFTKIDLFSGYVNNFYEQKRNSIGPERFIAKMHLNQLYGIFGRKHDLLETRNIYKEDLDKFISSRVIKTIIPINDKIITLLMHSNIKDDLIKKLNIELDTDISNYYYLVKANVAIASAVTSYSRIHMIPFKIDGNCVYSDTDSIFTTKNLKSTLIGSDLGLMKDELSGSTILEAYFLGIKRYGYQYLENDKLITRSVFSGVSRNSLTFPEILHLSKGLSLTKEIPLRFYKSLNSLSVTIKSTKITISRSLDKPLINNNYLAKHLHYTNTTKDSFFKYLTHKFKKYLNIFF